MEFKDGLQLISLLMAGAGALGIVVWRLIGYIDVATKDLKQQLDAVDARRSDNVRDLHTKIDSTAESLDGKFNVVRAMLDTVKEDYVRREDLDSHILRLEKSIESAVVAIDKVRTRFDEGFIEVVRMLGKTP